MHVKSWVFGEPRLHIGVLVGCIVVSDQMELAVLGRTSINLPQEAQPLLVSMLCHALTNDTSVEGVHRREQGRHAMTLVVVSHRLTATWLQRQAWLGPVKRLNLALLVAREDQCVFGWIEIQPDDVFQLLGKVFIVRHLETHHPMRLESMRLPDAPHARRTDAGLRCHTSRTPMRRVIRTLLGCQCHDGLDLARGNLRLSSRPRLILLDPRESVGYKSRSPACYCAAPDTELCADLFIHFALRCEQDHLGALRKPHRDRPARSPRF
ncbi:hypothetical protein D9M70_477640 [compost metagenome]